MILHTHRRKNDRQRSFPFSGAVTEIDTEIDLLVVFLDTPVNLFNRQHLIFQVPAIMMFDRLSLIASIRIRDENLNDPISETKTGPSKRHEHLFYSIGCFRYS